MWLISGNLAIWIVLVLEFWVPRAIYSRFSSKTQKQMFLLVSGCFVGAHPDGHQHGVSIQIPINLFKIYIRISCLRKILVSWILVRVYTWLPSFFSQILDFIYWTVWFLFWSILNGVTLRTSDMKHFFLNSLIVPESWIKECDWLMIYMAHFFHNIDPGLTADLLTSPC